MRVVKSNSNWKENVLTEWPIGQIIHSGNVNFPQCFNVTKTVLFSLGSWDCDSWKEETKHFAHLHIIRICQGALFILLTSATRNHSIYKLHILSLVIG